MSVSSKRVILLSEDRAGDLQEIPIEEISGARNEPLVGGAQLEIERRAAPKLLLTYSDTETQKFSEVARGIDQLAQQQPLRINPELDRLRCRKCNRLLPEKNGICPACVRRLRTLSRITAYMKPYKSKAAVLAAASLCTTGAELIPPLITKRLVDEVLVPVQHGLADMDARLLLLGMLVLGLVVVRMCSWGAELLHGWYVAWLGARVTADIRSHLYRQLEMMSMQYYDKRRVGGLISRVARDAGMLQEFLIDGLPYMVINGLMIIGILGFLFSMDWYLTLLLMIPIPLIVAWSVLFWRRMRRIFQKYGHGWAMLSARLSESLNGIRIVKAFAQETRELAAFEEQNQKLWKINRKTARNWFMLWATMGLATGIGIIVVWFFGGIGVLEGRLTLGTLLAFYAYTWLVYGPVEWFAQVNSWMTRAFAGAERIFEVIDTAPEEYENTDAVSVPRIEGEIRFDNVTFGYDKSKPVLRDLNLHIRAGEMVGLVGRSGVGKTTTVNMVARFYDVDHGCIEIDSMDIRNIKLKDLRRQIGIVSQDPILFSGTIRENIGYGDPGASFMDIVSAARAANAHDFVVAKPDGYDTRLGERGTGLSGGERQRIAIARAILHDPRILILDEATSAVDVQTEKQIQQAITRLVRGRTTLAIAHRLSTLRNADRLVLIDGGQVSEEGTHEELMDREGAFYELVRLQQQVSSVMAIGA